MASEVFSNNRSEENLGRLRISSIFCIIFKRVTDDKSNKLFYFLQKQSREWPLLNTIFWDQNGAIFADMTYGGFVIICTALIIGQAKGEFRYAKYTENFFLVMGALMYFGAASLELAALDSVQPSLVVNAAVLGVISLITGLIFILDLLLTGKRRKRPSNRIRTLGYDKNTQTQQPNEKPEPMSNVFETVKKIPANGVKILPTSPPMQEAQMYPQIPVKNSHNEYVGTITPPLYSPQELGNPKAKIRSTESFLRSEKGEIPVVRAAQPEVVIPPGYMLVPTKQGDATPPGYASVDQKFVPRKLQSPTVTTTVRTPTGYYYQDSRDPSPTEDSPPNEYAKYPAPMAKPWSLGPKAKSFDEMDTPFRRNSPYRSSSRQNMPDKRYEFPPDVEDTSLNGHKIDEEMRRIRDITKSDVDLTAEIAKENQALKQILRKEKEEKQKLQVELQNEERKRLEDQVNELKEYQSRLEKELRLEERMKLEQKIKELEDEKDRRVSEREIQYFGIDDVQKSKKESSPVAKPKLSDIEQYFKKEAEKIKGAQEINTKLKEKQTYRDDEELRKVIEEGFHFLDEEERKKRSEQLYRDVEERRSHRKKEDELPPREDTPASYKSEAQFWLGGKEGPPLSPKDPGYVLHTAQTWEDQKSPADRFRFSAKKANQVFKFTPSNTPSPDLDRASSEEEERSRGGRRSEEPVRGRGRGLLLRKVDFPEDPVTDEIERPHSAAGTSTWRRWLNNANKTKLHATRSTPH